MPVSTLEHALTIGLSIAAAFGSGSVITAFVSAKNNKGNYFLQGFKQLVEQHQAATAAATTAANTCAEKLAQRDQTIADRDKTIAQLRDDHDQQERDWKKQLYSAEEACHGYKLRLIDAGLLSADGTPTPPRMPAALGVSPEAS